MRQTSILTCLDQGLCQPEAKGPLGFEQQEIRTHCTVLFGVIMSGEKLSPFIVLTGTKDGHIARQMGLLDSNQQLFPVGIKYACQPKAWVDTDISLQWIEKVWQPFALGKDGEPIHLLLVDDFTVHKVGRCVDAIKNSALRLTLSSQATHLDLKCWM